jgi:hypothetical protein
VTKDNIMVMASEVGVYDTDPGNIVHKGRLKPGRMLLVDTKEKKYIKDDEIKCKLARSKPFGAWLQEQVTLDELRETHSGHLSYDVEVPNGEVNGYHELGSEDKKDRKQGFKSDCKPIVVMIKAY